MMTYKEDKRILKTKKLIRDTFFKLLEEKDFEKITIAEIADRAIISKGTFYYHYEDKYDFVQKLVDDIIREYKRFMAKRIKGLEVLSKDDVSEMFLYMTTRLLPEYNIMKKIHVPGLDFREKLETLMADEIENIIEQRNDLHLNNPKIIARTIASMQLTFGEQIFKKGETPSVENNLEIIQDIITTFNKLFF